jgi:hypothetical protein
VIDFFTMRIHCLVLSRLNVTNFNGPEGTDLDFQMGRIYNFKFHLLVFTLHTDVIEFFLTSPDFSMSLILH